MINEEQQDQKIEALREELRNGRRSDKTSKSALGSGEDTDRSARSGVQVTRRDNATASRDGSTPTDNKRGTQEKPKRIGQGSRRSGNNGSSDSDRGEQSTRDTSHAPAAIERIDDIPERVDPILPTKGRYKEDYRRTQRDAKNVYTLLTDPSVVIQPEEYRLLPNSPQAPKKGIFSQLTGRITPDTSTIRTSGKSTLTQQEAKEFLEPLASALVDYGGYIDKFLQYRTHDPAMPDIWGDMTEAEAQVLARLMIRRGQRSAAAASVVRNMVHGDDYIQAAIIVIPRVMRTVETTRRMPKRGRA